MDKRLIFPLTMFVLAAASFGYGTWQYIYAQRVQAAADARVAHIVREVDGMPVSERTKQELYADIFTGYPEAPAFLDIDLSGIFAATPQEDACANDGQRSVCRALNASGTDAAVRADVCGACDPR